MRDGNNDVLSETKYSDTAILDVCKTAAKLEMQMDVESALSIDIDDTTTLDEVTDNFSTRLARALSYKQLFLFYFKNNDGEGNKNDMRMNYYRQAYAKEALGFGSLSTRNSGATVTSTMILR